MTGDVDERGLKRHQRVDTVVESGGVAALQGWYQFETGERSLTAMENVDYFHDAGSLFRDDVISC